MNNVLIKDEMKKLYLTLSLLLATLTVSAIPAKPGLTKTITLTDGTRIEARLVGDEHCHYWLAADGRAYQQDGDVCREADLQSLRQRAKARRQQSQQRRTARMAQRRAGTQSAYVGDKRGLVILVNFKNKSFRTANNKTFFERMTNEEGFSTGRFKGSVADYFKAQSLGLFRLGFDVVGPVRVSQNYSYYGQNNADGNDMYPEKMVTEAVELAKPLVSDWSVYDWDGDGEVDQVYFIYAGYGEADYYDIDTNVIWPHEWNLEEMGRYGFGSGVIDVGNGLTVNTYACGSELSADGQTSGIGTMCHEFSHCLGYPDYYDIDYSGGQGMGQWDLMCAGADNGDGFQPAGYTSYERWTAGWAEPVVLEDEDVDVDHMPSLQSSGQSYIIYNKGHRDEFFLLENRQKDGWDASLPGAGLLILHVDYNASVWAANAPNDNPSRQRMTWIPADNKYDYQTYYGERYYTTEGMANDPFPYKQNNAFNKTTTPQAKFYNRNTDRTYFPASSVEQITLGSDKTVSFRFVADMDASEQPDTPLPSGALFYESFDKCAGKGGNDGVWSGSAASAQLLTDNRGWLTEKGYGGYRCAKFGATTATGSATTPTFTLNGSATLTFKAGAWDNSKDSETLLLSVEGGTVSTASVTMAKGDFSSHTATITGRGPVAITFASAQGRFFLDEVLVQSVATGIASISSAAADSKAVYSLDGRYMGTDLRLLPHGLYIVGGKKVVK